MADHELQQHSSTSFSLRGAPQGAVGGQYVWSLALQAETRSETLQWLAACARMQAPPTAVSTPLAAAPCGNAQQLQARLVLRLPQLTVSLLRAEMPDDGDADEDGGATVGGTAAAAAAPPLDGEAAALLTISLSEIEASSRMRAHDAAFALLAGNARCVVGCEEDGAEGSPVPVPTAGAAVASPVFYGAHGDAEGGSSGQKRRPLLDVEITAAEPLSPGYQACRCPLSPRSRLTRLALRSTPPPRPAPSHFAPPRSTSPRSTYQAAAAKTCIVVSCRALQLHWLPATVRAVDVAWLRLS